MTDMLRCVTDVQDPVLLHTGVAFNLCRVTWGSDAVVQSDCCDSIQTINNPFHYHGIHDNQQVASAAPYAPLHLKLVFIHRLLNLR